MTSLEYRFQPEAAMLREIRAKLRADLQAEGLAEQPVNRVLLALDEVVNNAIEHGLPYRAAGNLLHLQIAINAGDLNLDFFDIDVPEELVRHLSTLLIDSAGNPPDLDAERGRGLFLIDDAFDEVRIDIGQSGGMHLWGRFLKVLADR